MTPPSPRRSPEFLPTLTALAIAAMPALAQTTRPAASQPAAAATARLRIAVLGDSLTGDRPAKPYLHAYLKWPDLLGLMLETSVGLDQVHVINAGWAGDKTGPKPNEGWPGAADRLQADILDHRPDIVIILIGGNDKPRNDTEREATAQRLDQIAADLRNANVRTLFCLYPEALPDPQQPHKAWDLTQSNALIRQAAERHGHPVLDLQPAVAAATLKHPRTELVNPVDGVHLAPRGEMVFARAVFDRLRELQWHHPPAPPRNAPPVPHD